MTPLLALTLITTLILAERYVIRRDNALNEEEVSVYTLSLVTLLAIASIFILKYITI